VRDPVSGEMQHDQRKKVGFRIERSRFRFQHFAANSRRALACFPAPAAALGVDFGLLH
jgi:hypothetical protein